MNATTLPPSKPQQQTTTTALAIVISATVHPKAIIPVALLSTRETRGFCWQATRVKKLSIREHGVILLLQYENITLLLST
jgi:hypothetical protein